MKEECGNLFQYKLSYISPWSTPEEKWKDEAWEEPVAL